MPNEPLTRSLLRISVASLSFTAVLAIAALLSGDLEDGNAQILLSTLAVGVYAAAGAAGASGARVEATRFVAAVGVLASALGFVTALGVIWGEDAFDDDSLEQVWGILTVLAISCAQATVILTRRRETDSDALSAVITATLVAVAVLAVMAMGAISSTDASEEFFRLFGVVAVLDALGTALIPIIRKMGPSPSPLPATPVPMPAAQGARVVKGQVEDGLATALAGGATLVLAPTSEAASGATVAVAREPDGELVLFIESP